MAATIAFPQSGDNDDAEHFAGMLGISNIMDHVESGGTFTVDYGVPEVTITDTTAFISLGNQTASSTSETVRETGAVVQVTSNTISLTDSATNHIYVEPDIGTDDNSSFAAHTNTNDAASNALKIGEIDTSANTKNESYNRAPDLVSGTPFEVIDHQDGSTILNLPRSGALTLDTDIQFDSITGTPTFSGHDHTSGGMSSIPNSGLSNSSLTVTAGSGLSGGGSVSLGGSTTLSLTNDSLTVTAGDGLKNGGTVSLGGTTTLNIEPNDFAGSGLQDDGTDDLELVNDTVTVAGNSVSLGGSTTIDHSDTSNQSPDDHHSKYTDAEAVSATRTVIASGSFNDPEVYNDSVADWGVILDSADNNVKYVVKEENANIDTVIHDTGLGNPGSQTFFVELGRESGGTGTIHYRVIDLA